MVLHIIQSKTQNLHEAIRSLISSTLSALLTLIPPHWPPWSFSKKPSMYLTQGLCTCYSHCLECSFSRQPDSSLSNPLSPLCTIIILSEKVFSEHPIKMSCPCLALFFLHGTCHYLTSFVYFMSLSHLMPQLSPKQ